MLIYFRHFSDNRLRKQRKIYNYYSVYFHCTYFYIFDFIKKIFFKADPVKIFKFYVTIKKNILPRKKFFTP